MSITSYESAMIQRMDYVLQGYDIDVIKALQRAKQDRIYLQDILGKFPPNMDVDERIRKLNKVNNDLCKIIVYGKSSIQVRVLIDRIEPRELLPVIGTNSWEPVKSSRRNRDGSVTSWISGYRNTANPEARAIRGITRNKTQLPIDVLNKQGQVKMVLDKEYAKKHYKSFKNKKHKDDLPVPTNRLSDYKDDEFSFIWWYDKRGRLYPEGYQINPQGDKYRKGMLNFANSKKLSQSGLEWIYRYVAELAGYGGESFEDRLVIGKSIQEGKDEYPLKKKNPIITKFIGKELYVGMDWNIPVEVDSVNSGLQVLGISTNCVKTLEHTCVIGSKRNDAYGYVRDEIDESLDRDNDIKYSLMTHYFNSVKVPKTNLGEYYDKFLEVCKKEFKGPERFKKYVNWLWDDRAVYEWNMPDGFKVNIPVWVKEEKNIPILKKKGYKIKFGRKVYKPSGKRTHLLANLTHSGDAYLCREIIREFQHELITIHDAYLCHPNDVDELLEVYKYCLVRLLEQNPIKEAVYHLFGHTEKFKEEDFNKVFENNDLRNEVMNGIYALC